eukprot:TRINITY_DN6453_c1_g1_i1.p1 TRINITY_DN6453_c1_g1~~TRINITY_DN6453_c1_g1_i1.p1  ORF type:complete len:338 (-),score=38.00 TRINITY_DN6453_c1_g1_i1:143-1156(-)
MSLNLKKTVMFSTEGSGSVKCGREVLAAKTEISALGIKVCMDGEHRAKPLVGMERACGTLAAMPLGFSQKARIISSSIPPSCLYGVAYAPPSKVDAGTIRSRVATCLWGPKFKMRSPCAVANILLPGHTTDPLVVTLYRLLCTVVKVGRSDAELWDRMGRCAALYLQSDVEAQRRGSPGTSGNPSETMAAGDREELEFCGRAEYRDRAGTQTRDPPSGTGHDSSGTSRREDLLQRHAGGGRPGHERVVEGAREQPDGGVQVEEADCWGGVCGVPCGAGSGGGAGQPAAAPLWSVTAATPRCWSTPSGDADSEMRCGARQSMRASTRRPCRTRRRSTG